MSGGGEDLATSGLDEVAEGLTLALAELNELGMVGTAGAGRGFGDVALSGLEVGHDGLTGTLSSFCERWEWGVRALINEGNAFAMKTGLSAGTHYETDRYVEGTFKIMANAAIGNPYASEDEVTKMGWGDLATSGTFGGVDHSPESFDQARANMAQGWKDAGRDVMTSDTLGVAPGLNPQNMHSQFGVTDAQYEQWLDDTFGPSAQERAEAIQQQQQQGVPRQPGEGDG